MCQLLGMNSHPFVQDRLAIVVTEPLTINEDWTALAPSELVVFVDGAVHDCSLPTPLHCTG